MAAAVRPGGWLLAEDADYCSLVAADPAHPRAPRFDAVMRTLLAFIAAGRAFDPFFGRRLPGLVASAGLADAGHEAIACHRQGGGSAAEVLARSAGAEPRPDPPLWRRRPRQLRRRALRPAGPVVQLRRRAERRRLEPDPPAAQVDLAAYPVLHPAWTEIKPQADVPGPPLVPAVSQVTRTSP